ncbi:MAG TPA: hypothetical protein VHX44_20035, partial [Planctomycetota bacterium]|nr:hypothetical protein [Planctomycetota bacterium]
MYAPTTSARHLGVLPSIGCLTLLLGAWLAPAHATDLTITGDPRQISSSELLDMQVFRNQGGGTFAQQYYST